MKIVGNTVFWVGMIMLLKAIGIIPEVTSPIVWAVVVIVLGSAMKHGCHHGMCGKWMGMGKGMMGHKCSGADCAECNK